MADAKVTLSLDIDAQTGKITVIGQELDDLRGKTQAAGQAAQEASESTKALGDAHDELKSKIAALVSAGAIEEFFRKSIDLAVEDEEANRKLKFAVDSTGASYKDWTGKLHEYAEAQQATTQFDKTETIETLQKLIRVSGDVQQGLAATTLAENIAASGATDLAGATQIVTSLLAGQQRGLLMARKELGDMVGDADNATKALQNLQKNFTGVAQSQEGFSKSFAQSKNSISDFMKDVGSGLLPVLAAGAKAVASVAIRFQEFGVVIAEVTAEMGIRISTFGQSFIALMSHNFAQLPVIYRAMKAQIVEIEESSGAQLQALEAKRLGTVKASLDQQVALKAAHEKQSADDTSKIQDQMVQKFVQATQGEYAAAKVALDREVAAAEAAGVKQVSFVESGVTKTISLAQYRESQMKALFDKEENAMVDDEIAKQKAAQETDKKREALQKKEIKDTEQTLAFISTLQKSHNAELAAIGQAAAIARATIATYEGAIKAYDAMAGIPIVGPALGAAAAAAVIAAGTEDIAQIAGAQLESGGVAQGTAGGTRATIGENNKSEAVLPLDNPAAMAKIRAALAPKSGDGGGSGDTFVFNITNNLPGIEAIRDRSLIRALLDEIGEALRERSPEAVKMARLSSDLAQMNSRRAV